jgi:hypothetical protein
MVLILPPHRLTQVHVKPPALGLQDVECAPHAIRIMTSAYAFGVRDVLAADGSTSLSLKPRFPSRRWRSESPIARRMPKEVQARIAS